MSYASEAQAQMTAMNGPANADGGDKLRQLMQMAMIADIMSKQPSLLQDIQKIAALNNMVPNQTNPAIANAEAVSYQNEAMQKALGLPGADLAYARSMGKTGQYNQYDPHDNPLAVKWLQDMKQGADDYWQGPQVAAARKSWLASHPFDSEAAMPQWLKGPDDKSGLPSYRQVQESQGMISALNNGYLPPATTPFYRDSNQPTGQGGSYNDSNYKDEGKTRY